MKKFFITGTSTSIGKTFFSALLCEYYLNKNLNVTYIKPVQTGWPESDAEFILNFNNHNSQLTAKTLFSHKKPVAPCLVFEPFPFNEAVDHINSIDKTDILIVESAGGIMVPLDSKTFNYEFAEKCNLSIILVVPNKLGCVNDTLLNHFFIKQKKLSFEGIALNNFFSESEFDLYNKNMLIKYTNKNLFCEFNNKIENLKE
jgi:dethiobiotin synthetase